MQTNTRWMGFYTALLLMIAPAMAGAAPASQENNPGQVGKSSIYFYDVAPNDMHGQGRLMIDVDKHTFVFNGQDFVPSAWIELRARATDCEDHIVFASGQATPSGNLHIAGTWEGAAAPAEVVTGYALINGLALDNVGGLFIAKVACYYSTDGGVTWTESSHTDGITDNHSGRAQLDSLGVPDGALVRMHAIVVGGKDRTGSEVYQYSYWNVGTNGSVRYAVYMISGVTWNPKLEFYDFGDVADW